MISQLRRRL